VNYGGGLTLGSTNSSATIDLNGQTLTLSGGLPNNYLNLTSGGNYYINSTATGGTMLIASNYMYFPTSGTLTFAANSILDLQIGLDGGAAGLIKMNGKLQIDGNGYMANNGHAPTYGPGSVLNYNTGGAYTPQPGSEWYENTFAQPGVPYNVTITTSGTVLNFNGEGNPHEMWGDLTINASTTFSLNSATIGADFKIKGNWNNSGSFNCDGREVIFEGSTLQTMTGATTFDYLQLTNSAGLAINNDATVGTQLIFASGIITTGSNKVVVTSTSGTSVVGNGTGNYVNGNLRRYVASSTSYDLPVGSSSNYELANITFSSGMSGTSYLDANFTATAPTAPSPSTCIINGSAISSALNAGYWTIHPDNQPSAGTYTSTLNLIGYTNSPAPYSGYTSGHMPMTITPAMQIGLIKRTNSSSSWLGCGVTVYGNSATDQMMGSTTTVGGTISGGVATVTRTSIPSFSDFSIGIEQNPTYALPVELIYFTAENNNNNALLSWATASEVNNDHFDVERSLDGVNFEKIGQVAGHGNSTITIDYSYTDADISAYNASVIYYRLKQVDADGNFTYTNIATINVGNTQQVFHIISSYPNPFSDHFSVSFYAPVDQPVIVTVYDVSGALISEETISAATGMNVYSVPGALHLASGFYSMNVNAGGQNFGIKMLKQ
jgi:hypothetical protein